MDQIINTFVHLLRQRGVRVSPAETVDALLALRQVDLGERQMVHDTLCATLIKNSDDQATFATLFDLYFGLHTPVAAPAVQLTLNAHEHSEQQITGLELGEDAQGDAINNNEHSHEDGSPLPLQRFFDEEKLRPLANMHGDADRLRVSLFAQELVLNRKQDALQKILQKITVQLRVRRARNLFNPGGLAPLSNSEELPMDIAAAELDDLIDQLDEMDVDEALVAALKAQADNIIRGLPELLKQFLERQRKLATKEPDEVDLQKRSLRRLLDFSPSEEREMEAAVRRIARQIHGASARRLHQDRAGRINVAHTLRHNLRYDGIPFQPVLRRHHEQRPRLVLLCDVSLSTRNLARFWLHLVHQLQGLFAKVRTFVFVAESVEVTHLFEEQRINRAVETIFGGKLLDVDANSDFGKAAEQFQTEFLNAVTQRTTVVILGDGRNNGKPANEKALAEIARHAKQVIWLTPEPKWGWTLGSCDMALYEPYCTRIEVVRTIEQLANVAEVLASVRQ